MTSHITGSKPTSVMFMTIKLLFASSTRVLLDNHASSPFSINNKEWQRMIASMSEARGNKVHYKNAPLCCSCKMLLVHTEPG